jgi:hypothetical protein
MPITPFCPYTRKRHVKDKKCYSCLALRQSPLDSSSPELSSPEPSPPKPEKKVVINLIDSSSPTTSPAGRMNPTHPTSPTSLTSPAGIRVFVSPEPQIPKKQRFSHYNHIAEPHRQSAIIRAKPKVTGSPLAITASVIFYLLEQTENNGILMAMACIPIG